MNNIEMESELPKWRVIMAKIFGGLTILFPLILILVLALAIYFQLLNRTYLLLLWSYLGMGITVSPLIGYYLVRATDIVSFIGLLLGMCGFFLLSLFSLPRFFDIAKTGHQVHLVIYYFFIFYLIFTIVFSVSALIKRRISVMKSLLPVIPLFISIILSVISGVFSAVIMKVGGEYAYLAMIVLTIVISLILLGSCLFCLIAMCKTIYTEANKQSD